jgi:hypothetical protein
MKQTDFSDESAPFGWKWRTIYIIVIAMLALKIILFYAFTLHFS